MDNAILREQYEWSQLWWNNANDPSLPRVLLIGDSIEVGYSPVVTTLLQDSANVDRMGNSRSINDPALMKEAAYVLSEFDYAAIHFNNGLHGSHLTDEAYGVGLRRYVQLLRELGKGARLIWASSTPITTVDEPQVIDEAKNTQVIRRNAVAAQVMAECGIPVNNLYQLVVGQANLRAADGYHYNEQGYRVLGTVVAAKVCEAMGR